MSGSSYSSYSGLIASQKGLDVESNNVSNVNTTSFKSDTISFADILYNKGVGVGTTTSTIDKSFTQGNMKNTDNPYDLSIYGDGFFKVKNDITNEEYYTKDGHLQKDFDGFLETIGGLQVQGVVADYAGKVGDEHSEHILSTIQEDADTIVSINIFSTDYNKDATDDLATQSGSNYKTAASKIEDIDALKNGLISANTAYNYNSIDGNVAVMPEYEMEFNPARITNTSILSVDIDGIKYYQNYTVSAEETLNALSDKLSSIKGITSSVDVTTGVMNVKAIIPGENITLGEVRNDDDSTGFELIATTNTVPYQAGTGKLLYQQIFDELEIKVAATGGSVIQSTGTIDKTLLDPTNFSSIQLDLKNLDIRESDLNLTGEFSLDGNNIYITQGDGKYLIARLVPVNFMNNGGLNPQGDNLYMSTKDSGTAKGTSLNIESHTLEMSNADLSQSLVNLMVFQRSFEANSKALTTSDELIKQAINLKK